MRPLQAQLSSILLHVSLSGVLSYVGSMAKAHMGLLWADFQHPKTLSQAWRDKDTEPHPFRGAVPQRSWHAVVAWQAQKWHQLPQQLTSAPPRGCPAMSP